MLILSYGLCYPQKPNNKAPKDVCGNYELTINGNAILLVDNKDGLTAESKCHPEDNFDIGEGVRQAFNNLMEKRKQSTKVEIKVEDFVSYCKKPNMKLKVIYIDKGRNVVYCQDENGFCHTFTINSLKKVGEKQ